MNKFTPDKDLLIRAAVSKKSPEHQKQNITYLHEMGLIEPDLVEYLIAVRGLKNV